MDTSAVVKSYYKAHNASAPAFKAQLSALRKVADRAVEAWEASPIRGASPVAFINVRLTKFCDALRTSSIPDQDTDLLPAAHPALAAVDPWSALVSAEDRLASLAKSALSGITRAGLRKQSLNEVNEAHRRLVHLFDLNFATNSVSKSATGVCRADLVAATALVHEELERRGAVVSPQHALYKEACDARAAAPSRVTTGFMLHRADSVVLCLPGLGSLSIANRLPTQDVEKSRGMWSPDGSKYHYPLREPAEAAYTVLIEKAEECDGATYSFNFSPGAVTPGFTEVFVHGAALSGVLLVGPESVTLRKQLQPYVVTSAAVAAAWMPPDGESALPQSLEQDVPPEFRYWKAADGEDPAEIRAQLVKSGILGAGCVALVNGQPRRVVSKMFVAESYGAAPSQFAHAQLELSAVDAVAELAKAEPKLVEAEDLPAAIEAAAWTDDYLIGSRNSEDVVKSLAALGRPFYAGDDRDYVFVSARAVPGVEYAAAASAQDSASVRLLKNDSDQRYVLGVVLEPETVDAQNDIYSVDEVMKSAHTFLAEFRNAGLQHQTLVNDKVRIVESYLAPADFSLNGEPVKKGTWLIGMIVDDESIWKAIKSGALTGFSIGGSAVRTGA